MRHFTIEEMCVSSSYPELVKIPEEGGIIFNNIKTLVEEVLDKLRDGIGRPIKVTSGYRNPELNARVKGSKTSAHLKGLAADIVTGNCGTDNIMLAKKVLELSLDFDQLILEGLVMKDKKPYSARWVHIGIGNKNRKQVLYTSDFKHYNSIEL